MERVLQDLAVTWNSWQAEGVTKSWTLLPLPRYPNEDSRAARATAIAQGNVPERNMGYSASVGEAAAPEEHADGILRGGRGEPEARL